MIYHEEPTTLAMFAICIKREVIEKCGYLDESYGIGMFEDDDFSRAAKVAGYQLCIAEDSFVHHYDSFSFKKLGDEKYRELLKENMEKYNNKWKTKWQPHKYRDGVSGESVGLIEI